MARLDTPDDALTPTLAVQIAAAVWGAMLVLLLAVAAFTLVTALPTMSLYTAPTQTGTFLAVVVVVLIVVPAALLTHRWLFRRYWHDGLVRPRGYLLASILLYCAITLCVILALLGSVVDGTLFPHSILAGLLVMVLLSVWPSGRAMRVRRPRGQEDDDVELLHWAPEDEQDGQTKP